MEEILLVGKLFYLIFYLLHKISALIISSYANPAVVCPLSRDLMCFPVSVEAALGRAETPVSGGG